MRDRTLRAQSAPYSSLDYSKIKVGTKSLEDATMRLGDMRTAGNKYGDKAYIYRMIKDRNVIAMRDISNFYYEMSGIYTNLCDYMSSLYRYDWFVTPYIDGGVSMAADEDLKDSVKTKVLNNFFSALNYLDDFNAKKFFNEAAGKVIRNGAYYGYIMASKGRVQIQELDVNYSRSIFKIGNTPIIEFNMHYFDERFRTDQQRELILKMLPLDFTKGYRKFKNGDLKAQFPGDRDGWYALEPGCAFKFSINERDCPPFIATIPSIIDLDEAKGLDREKVRQRLMKIVLQTVPRDKNDEMIFDIDEIAALHGNSVRMIGGNGGVRVLTTPLDVEVADMSDKGTSTQTDDLTRVERSLYNESGRSEMLFNSSSNIGLSNSIVNDEAVLTGLIMQFQEFLNLLLEPFNKTPKKICYRAQILRTTNYNYKDLAKLYQEQMKIGYSKMLAQIALGQSQSSILATAYFENDILDLINVFVPPLSSNTMNADALNKDSSGSTNKTSTTKSADTGSDKQAGRPQKSDSEKSDKTIANQESM